MIGGKFLILFFQKLQCELCYLWYEYWVQQVFVVFGYLLVVFCEIQFDQFVWVQCIVDVCGVGSWEICVMCGVVGIDVVCDVYVVVDQLYLYGCYVGEELWLVLLWYCVLVLCVLVYEEQDVVVFFLDYGFEGFDQFGWEIVGVLCGVEQVECEKVVDVFVEVCYYL